MFMLLLIFSTAPALAMQDLRLKAVYIFWTSFALAFAGLKNAKKNTPGSADYQGWRKLEVHLWGTYQTTSYVLKRSLIEERSPTFFPLGSSGAAPYGVGNCLQVGWRTREKLQPLGIKNEHFVILISCLLYISSTVAGQTFFSLKNKS